MTERAEFEQWYANNFNRRPTEGGHETDICWQAWQAARRLRWQAWQAARRQRQQADEAEQDTNQ